MQKKQRFGYDDEKKREPERSRKWEKVKKKMSSATIFVQQMNGKLYSFRVLFLHLAHGKLYDQTHQLNRIEFINNSQPISFYSKVKSLLSMEFRASNRQKEQSLWFLFIFFFLFSLPRSLYRSLFVLCCCFFSSSLASTLFFFCHRFSACESVLCTLRVCSNLSAIFWSLVRFLIAFSSLFVLFNKIVLKEAERKKKQGILRLFQRL